MQSDRPKKEKTQTMRAIILEDFDSSPGLRQDLPAPTPTDRVHIVVGAITAPAAVDDAVRRGQAVISTLGPDMSRKATGLPLVEGARLIVTAMQRHQNQRFIGMATPSVLDPRDRRTLQPRVSTLLARTYDEIVGMSNIIMSSDRTWTLV